ncbi:esterase [Arthrobacter phage AbbyDaisy]|nr:esterase [Arthrobacter phage AbbyDaisy]
MAASIAALALAGGGVAGYSVYQTSQASAEAAAQASSYKPSAPSIAPNWPAMAVVGDSFAMKRDDAWPYRSAFCTGHFLALSGVGGSGFWNDGKGERYAAPARIAEVMQYDPDIIVLESAYNDSFRAEKMSWRLKQHVLETIKAYQKAAPKAKIVVFGPIWAIQRPTVGIENNREVLESAAKETGVLYVDGLGLLPDSTYTGKDLKHPNAKGHVQITSRLVGALKKAGMTGSNGCENVSV